MTVEDGAWAIPGREIRPAGQIEQRPKRPKRPKRRALFQNGWPALEAGTASAPALAAGKSLEEASPHLARRKRSPVPRQPKPYLMLRRRLMEEASGKYFVGQLTSAM